MAEGDPQARDPLDELGPLPGGHHGLSREQILDSQRERLLAAIAHEVAAHGYRATTITGIVKTASVSTRDFYEHFEGKEDCFLAAFEAVRDHVQELVNAAVAEEPEWPRQVVAALRTVLNFFAAHPDRAQLCISESVSATPSIAVRFRVAILSCAPALARGRTATPAGKSLPLSTEDSLLGGIISLTTRSILTGETEELPALLPDLVEFTLSPYLGAEPAAELASASRSS